MSLRMLLDDLIHDHGDAIVRKAFAYLPQLIRLIKAGKVREIDAAIAKAHEDADAKAEAMRQRAEQERTARQDEPTVTMRVDDTGEAR